METRNETKKRKTYRNFTRSEKAIIRAYVELMQKNGGERISVTDIVNTADLNRSTFYAHFKTSDDVRARIHSDIITELVDAIGQDDYRNLLSDPDVVLSRVLKFIKKDEELYKKLLCTEGAPKFLKMLEQTVIDRYFTDEVIMPQIKDRDEFATIMRIFIGGFTSVLQDWAMDDIKVPLERVIEMTEYLIKNSAKFYLKK